MGALLMNHGTDARLRDVLADKPSFERLIRFLSHGKREEVGRFYEWLAAPNSLPPPSVRQILGAEDHKIGAANSHESKLAPESLAVKIPAGEYDRLIVVGGHYSPRKRERIQEAAGTVVVEFVPTDTNFRDYLQTVDRRDLLVINPTQTSHATTQKVIDFCRSNGINWMMMPYSGYERIAAVAERIRR